MVIDLDPEILAKVTLCMAKNESELQIGFCKRQFNCGMT